ncbi:MAG: hypothetical protein AAB395_00965 [Patescibacteria group bacterium]
MKALSSRKKSSKRRKIIIFVVILALIGVGAGGYYYKSYDNQDAKDELSIENDQQFTETDNSIKNDDDSEKPTEGLPDNSSSVTSDQVETNPSLSVSITSTSQSDGMVRALAKTSGTGTCVFLYRPDDGGKPVSKSVAINGNQCSFSASQNDFTFIGPWNLTVTYYDGGKKVEAVKNVTIN